MTDKLRAAAQEACSVCNEVHSILDADESQIIRDAKDGYPEGRTPRVFTLQERVTALCRYASDWKRWYLDRENTAPPRKEWVGLAEPAIKESLTVRPWVGLTAEDMADAHNSTSGDVMMRLAGFARAIEAKLREKNG